MKEIMLKQESRTETNEKSCVVTESEYHEEVAEKQYRAMSIT